MTQETNIAAFESKGMAIMQTLSDIEKAKKELDAQDKKIRAQLTELAEQYGIKSIDNEFVKITYVAGSVSVSLDTAAILKKEPELIEELMRDFPLKSVDWKRVESEEPTTYEALMKDYPKESKRKAYIRISVK